MNLYLVIEGQEPIATNATEEQVREALSLPNVTLEQCNVYCCTDIRELPMNGVEWLLDNPALTTLKS